MTWQILEKSKELETVLSILKIRGFKISENKKQVQIVDMKYTV